KRAAAAGNKFYGNKITTEQLLALNDHNLVNPGQSIDVLDLFFNHYLAGIKVIFIVRDGRTCVRSKMTRTGKSVEQACKLWGDSVGVCRFLESHHHKNIRLRYEDLVTAPKENLEKICAFLGIEFQPEMLGGTANRKLRTEYQRDTLDTSKLELKDIPAGCMERIRDELRYCGYLP
ncbi:MAG TPA: sulfotransferase, partial [Verrucomicrobiae bacterium]